MLAKLELRSYKTPPYKKGYVYYDDEWVNVIIEGWWGGILFDGYIERNEVVDVFIDRLKWFYRWEDLEMLKEVIENEGKVSS